MFGHQAWMPINIMYEILTPRAFSHAEYAERLHQNLESAYCQVRVQLGHKLCRQKDIYDRKVHGKLYECGDLVWLHSPAVSRGQSKKLWCPWTGPFCVVRKLSDAVYHTQNTQAPRQCLVVHFDCLKLCPPDIRLPITTPPGSQSPGDPPGEPTPQPPGTTLKDVDNVNQTTCCPQQQQPHPMPPTHYPWCQHSAPDYYCLDFT